VAVLGLLFSQLSGVKATKLAAIEPKLAAAAAKDQQFTTAYGALKKERERLDKLGGLTADRYYWTDTLPEFRKVLLRVEEVSSNKWQAAAGVWIEQFVTPAAPDGISTDPQFGSSQQSVGAIMQTAIEQKYGLSIVQPGAADPNAAPVVPSPAVSTVFMVCRAIKGPNDSANSELMYVLLDTLKTNSIVDPKATQVGERLISDDSKYTFTFAVKVGLKNPLKF